MASALISTPRSAAPVSVVAFHTVEALGCAREAAEYIAAAYHYGYLDAARRLVGYLAGILPKSFGINTVAAMAHKRLAAELQ